MPVYTIDLSGSFIIVFNQNQRRQFIESNLLGIVLIENDCLAMKMG